MAKVRGPLHSEDAGGRVGSNIYSRNQYGHYVYASVVLPLPDSTEQVKWQTAMHDAWDIWVDTSKITAARRLGWLEFSRQWLYKDRFGKPCKLQPFQWFFLFSVFRLYAGYTPHYFPPLLPSCSYTPIVALDVDEGGIFADITGFPTGDNLLYFQCVPAQNTTRYFSPNKTHHPILVKSSSSDPPYLWDNADLASSKKRYFFRLTVVDGSGRPSPHQYFFIDATQVNMPTTFSCIADTFLYSQDPSTPYGTVDYLPIADHETWWDHGLLKFDVSECSPSWTASECLLYLYFYYLTYSATVQVYQVLRDWSETQACWLYYQGSSLWDVPGCGPPFDRTNTVIDSQLVDSVPAWYAFDITSIFNSWIHGTDPNAGLFLNTSNFTQHVACRTREYTTPSLRPYLQVTW